MGGIGGATVIFSLILYLAVIIFLFVMLYRFVKAQENMAESMDRIVALLKNNKFPDRE